MFAVTRSHAENHFNARVRIQAQNDRLRREVSLLNEELRIKDAGYPPRGGNVVDVAAEVRAHVATLVRAR